MGTLSASLLGAANALDAFQYALGVAQNNIGNASTPGYAKQVAVLQALPFDPAEGLAGGVSPGPTVNTRDLLAERGVWQQAAAQGDASARNAALASVQNALPISDGSGIPAALTAFFSAASAWSASPNDSGARQAVMDSAGSLVASFQTAAAAVAGVSRNTDQSIHDTVDQINGLTAQLASLNAGVQNGGLHDAGLQARIYSTLETLSGLADITVLPQQDGTVMVSLTGGAALVVGSDSYALSVGAAAVPADPLIDTEAPPHTVIRASDGSDITSQIQSGTLHGLLKVRNVTIPGLTGDAGQPGALNQLAQTMALRINQIVSQGSVSPGVPAASGLFLTDPAHPTSAAARLALDPAMSGRQLPAIDANGVANGVPLALAALANPQQDADKVDSVSYTEFYGNAAAQVGRDLNQAQSDRDLAGQLVAQARSLRQTESGVSLDEEAIHVLQFQQGYQAVAKLVSTLDELTQAVINMMH
jgi:flagellar hook-associated protein 1 FlgK